MASETRSIRVRFTCPFCSKQSEPWKVGYCCGKLQADTEEKIAALRARGVLRG